MSATQTNRPIAVTSPLADDTLLLSDVRWQERLGQPFSGELRLLSEQGDIDPADLLGQAISIRLGSDDDAGTTHLHGCCLSFWQTEPLGGFYTYKAELVPWFSLLQHVGGTRIFQQQSVIDIFKSLAEERGFSGQIDDRLTGDYQARAYCVQYDESDFHFLSRLLEEIGVYYFFEYTDEQHTMVLADDVGAHQAADGYDSLTYHEKESSAKPAAIFYWQSGQRFATASCVLRDYDFQKPRADMTVRQNAEKTCSQWQWYHFPGRYFESDLGQTYARVRTEATVANQNWIEAETSVNGIRCGNKFTVESHPLDDANQEYIVSGAVIEASSPSISPSSGGDGTFGCKLAIHPSSIPFRNVPTTQRPVARGPHIATVVGKDGEEIWTDSYGRIKVLFAWDRDGAGDDTSSCWIRVTQPWTGKGFGAASIPRVGEEVVVSFIDGDIDRPIVTGRVYNADRMPPEALADGQAKTVFRTRSTKDGDVDAFHELTFDDTADQESIYFHSERDFERVVENNDSLKVGFEKADPGDQSIEINNDQTVQIGKGSGSGSQTIEIAQDRSATLQSGDDSLKIDSGGQTVEISQDRSVTIQSGDDTLTIESGDRTVQASGGAITIEAATGITLKCGASSIEITPSGISIKSTQINAAADGDMELAGSVSTTVKADGNVVVQGAMVQIN